MMLRIRLSDKITSCTRSMIGLTAAFLPSVILAEVLVTERIDGSPVSIIVDRPVSEHQLPIVLFVDGSGCQSANRKEFQDFARLPESKANSIAKAFVDKSGVVSGGGPGQCTQEFLNRYTIQQRVLDHLRAIQHLRSHAAWWNKEMYVVGWSDGGSIAISVAAFTPEVKRAVFLGTGGGMPMTRQFEEYILCAPDRTKTSEACVQELAEIFDDIRANPSPKKSWMGDMNTYNAWASRIDMVEFNLIKDLRIPILIVHGANDRDSVPIQSARELVRLLDEHGEVDFEYWEIPDAGHNIGIRTEGRSGEVRAAMMNWLFEIDSGAEGSGRFGRSPIE